MTATPETAESAETPLLGNIGKIELRNIDHVLRNYSSQKDEIYHGMMERAHSLIGDPCDGYAAIDAGSQLYSSCYANQGRGVPTPLLTNIHPRYELFLESPPGTHPDRRPGHISVGGAFSPNASSFRWETAPIERNENTTQLTIFYGGTVNVYDHVPAHKVKTILLLASSGNLHMNGNAPDFGHSSRPTSQTEEVLSGMGNNMQLSAASYNRAPHTLSFHADLPLKRKHSLQRFMKKREERLNSRAHYD